MPDYRYDVFFSHRRAPQTNDWVARVVAMLRFWLRQELADDRSEIFWDQDGIEVGDRWPEVLRIALQRSKCMVALCSSTYFESKWCSSEWESFRERERILDLTDHGLIVPARYHDCEQRLKDIQYADLAKYTSTLPGFWKTSRAVQLEDEIKKFAKSVALVVRRAPAFQEWPVKDGEPTVPAHVELRRL